MVEENFAVVRVLEEGWGGRIDFTDVPLRMEMDENGSALPRHTIRTQMRSEKRRICEQKDCRS